jgi:hypothetical protein
MAATLSPSQRVHVDQARGLVEAAAAGREALAAEVGASEPGVILGYALGTVRQLLAVIDDLPPDR